jgi:hypothetical protein
MTRPPLKPFAGIGIADREGNEAEREGQHQNVHHGVLQRLNGQFVIEITQ